VGLLASARPNRGARDRACRGLEKPASACRCSRPATDWS